MLLSLPSGVRETLEEMGVMAFLHDSGFDMALSFMEYCRSRDVNFPQCASSWIPNDYSMCEVSNFLSRSVSSTHCRSA